MKSLKTQLHDIFNLQSFIEIYHYLSSIWFTTFKIVATILITYAVTFTYGFLHMLENSNPTTFPEFYDNLLEIARTSTGVASSVLASIGIFLALKFGFYLLLLRNQGRGTRIEQAKICPENKN